MKAVYYFGDGVADGQADMKNLLGGKGANLAEMTSLGIPVPAGLTITTEVCTYYYENSQKFPNELEEQLKESVDKQLIKLKKEWGKILEIQITHCYYLFDQVLGCQCQE